MRREPAPGDKTSRQRRSAVRTALLVGAIAVAIYIAFILSGVLAT